MSAGSAMTFMAVCPHCGHEQEESMEGISTNCRTCRGYFVLEKIVPMRRSPAPKRTRLITCPHCEIEQKVYPHALTTMCVGCGLHLNITNYTVSGGARQSLATYGEVTFTPRCRYAGAEVRAQVIRASGQLRTRLKAYRELWLSEQVEVSGPVQAPSIVVLAGARVRVPRVSATALKVQGFLRAESVVVQGRLVVESGGYLSARMIRAMDLEVAKGAGLEGDFAVIPVAPPSVTNREAEDEIKA